MNPNTIPLEETWDLSLIYDSPEAFGDDLKKAEDLLTVLSASRDDFANSRENFLRFNENMVSFNRLLNKLYNYAHLHCDKEPAIQDYQYRLSQVLSLDEIRAQKLDWVELAIIAHQEDIKVYLEDEAFRVYRYSIAQTLRDQEHLLTQEMETLLSEAASISDVSGQVFDAFRLDYDDIMVDGQMQTLN
ncbi:MAG: oligoendopeptidase F, partial [bacterium]